MQGIVLNFSKTVYWPIPKNACTTMKAHLVRLLDIPCKDNPHRAKFQWTSKPIKGYRNWAIIRNPYIRIFSLWANKVAEGHPIHPSWLSELDPNVFGLWASGIIESGMDFEDFVTNLLNSGKQNQHWDPQSTMVPEQCEIAKLEDIGSSFNVFLPSLNPNHIKRDWRKFITNDSIRDLIYNYYRLDFEQFNYSKYITDTILIDCDGVLTDGNLTIDHKGEKQFKRFHTRDVRAIRELVYHGFRVIIVSADDWEGIFHFAQKVGAEVLISRDKKDLPFENYIAIGDDCWDIPMLKKSIKAFTPFDADYAVCQIDGVHKLKTPGGQGVIAEFVREILG